MEPPTPAFIECTCTGVSRARVLLAIARGCRTVTQLQNATGVCTGCRTCRPEVEQLLRETLAERSRLLPPRPVPGPAAHASDDDVPRV